MDEKQLGELWTRIAAVDPIRTDGGMYDPTPPTDECVFCEAWAAEGNGPVEHKRSCLWKEAVRKVPRSSDR